MDDERVTMDRLAHLVAIEGVEPHWSEVVDLVAAAAALGVTGPALDALLDGAAPCVLRQRAFGRVAAGVEHARSATLTPALVSGGLPETLRRRDRVVAAAGQART